MPCSIDMHPTGNTNRSNGSPNPSAHTFSLNESYPTSNSWNDVNVTRDTLSNHSSAAGTQVPFSADAKQQQKLLHRHEFDETEPMSTVCAPYYPDLSSIPSC